MPSPLKPYRRMTLNSLFIFTCKSLSDKNEPTLDSVLLGYGQQMYRASANFCDA